MSNEWGYEWSVNKDLEVNGRDQFAGWVYHPEIRFKRPKNTTKILTEGIPTKIRTGYIRSTDQSLPATPTIWVRIYQNGSKGYIFWRSLRNREFIAWV
jgi:hypothetical protein